MSEAAFTHDDFLNHSSKDNAVVRKVAERLRADELKECFDVDYAGGLAESEAAPAMRAKRVGDFRRHTLVAEEPQAHGCHATVRAQITPPLMISIPTSFARTTGNALLRGSAI